MCYADPTRVSVDRGYLPSPQGSQIGRVKTSFHLQIWGSIAYNALLGKAVNSVIL